MNKPHDNSIKKIIKILATLGCGYVLFKPLILVSVILLQTNPITAFYILYPLLLGIIMFLLIKDTLVSKILYGGIIALAWIFLHSTNYSLLFL